MFDFRIVIAGQGATIAVTVISLISVCVVREAKRGAVGATASFDVPALWPPLPLAWRIELVSIMYPSVAISPLAAVAVNEFVIAG